MAYTKFSAFEKAVRMLTTSFIVGYNQGGENFRIQYTDLIQQLDLAGGAGGGVPIYIEGTQLPSTDNEGNPLEKGDWAILEQGKTYSNINGGSEITTPLGRLSFTQYNGSTWSLIDMGVLPTTPKTNVIEQGNTDVPESDAVWRSLDKRFINKGKAYPFVNQPDPLPARVITANNAILDFLIEEEEHDPAHDYTVMLLAKNNTTGGQWGNAVGIKRIRRSDGVAAGSYTISTTGSTTSEADKAELNKMNNGGLQSISFYNSVFNKRFTITIDCDDLADNTLLDLSYTNTGNDMYFSGGVYKKVTRVQFNDFISTKSTVDALNTFNLNKGKSYPFINQPAEAVITTVNGFILDAKVYGGDYQLYTYTIVGIYKNHVAYAQGILLGRTRKSDGVRGYQFLRTSEETNNTTSAENRQQLLKIADTGVQTLQLTDVWGMDWDITISAESVPEGFLSFGFQSNASNWVAHAITPANYLSKIKPAVPLTSISEFSTFRKALVAKQTGIVKVGSFLAEASVKTVNFPGAKELYKPSAVWKQYRLLNSASPVYPKKLSQIITFEDLDGYATGIKSFGQRYIYFGNAYAIYRTEDELAHTIITSENTRFEKIILDNPLPDSFRTNAGAIMNCYELDNGELLIEVRNGKKEDPESDYQGHRTQVYLTSGLKSAPRNIVNGITEIDASGIVTKVTEYKAYTNTKGKTGTTVSIVGNRIALAPYYVGLTGLIHYSEDYGETWKVIFNMGVMDEDFAVPYKGTAGAWPLPENLVPPMPADMWTAGGNTNYHVHGCAVDPYSSRIWVCTGDAGQNYLGRSALWYTDDAGQTWTRMQTKGSGVLDSYSGLQPMGVTCLKNYVLVGSDSSTDGLYRWNKGFYSDVPELEPAWWHNDEYDVNLKVIYGGSAVTDEGHVYSIFHTNNPTRYDAGVVNFTPDGLFFEDVYKDEVSDGAGVFNITWGSWIGKDRHGNIYIANANNTVIKLF